MFRRFGDGIARAAIYVWASPGSMVGLCGACLAWVERGEWEIVDGVLEVTGPRLLARLSRRAPVGGGIRAITLGHVVIGCDRASLIATRTHERVHVRQYERWGPLFIPVYLGCSVWLWFRGGHPYLDNPFEQEAFAVDSGDGTGLIYEQLDDD